MAPSNGSLAVKPDLQELHLVAYATAFVWNHIEQYVVP